MHRPIRPLDTLRVHSEQIRKAAALLAELAEDTADVELPSARGTLPTDEAVENREATILQAQRSFAASLRLAQVEVRPESK
ncbi:MAG: hypothetical protein ACKVZ0_07470 [Gemmatimonadales bacterium]